MDYKIAIIALALSLMLFGCVGDKVRAKRNAPNINTEIEEGEEMQIDEGEVSDGISAADLLDPSDLMYESDESSGLDIDDVDVSDGTN